MIKKSKKYIYILLLTGFLFILSGGFCLAFKISITSIPKMPQNPTLPQYITVVFSYIMQVSGAIAVLALIVAAIRWLTSAGSTEKLGEAKKSIYAAIFGLALLFSSVMILRTINPELTEDIKLEVKSLDSLDELYLIGTQDGKSIERPCPSFVSNTADLTEGLNTIATTCLPGNGTYFLVSLYDSAGLKGNRTNVEIDCEGTRSVPIVGKKSFSIMRKGPGVYLFDKPCGEIQNAEFRYFTSTVFNLGDFFNKTPTQEKCVQIINDNTNNIYYGAILHQGVIMNEWWDSTSKRTLDGNWGGGCSGVMAGKIEGNPRPTFPIARTGMLGISWNALTVFRIQPNLSAAGDGVEFFSNTFQNKKNVGGSYWVGPADMDEDDQFEEDGFYRIYAGAIKFYYDPGVPKPERERCGIEKPDGTFTKPNFQRCPGSLWFRGNYAVVLQTEAILAAYSDFYCEVFYQNQGHNLSTEPITNQTTYRKPENSSSYELIKLDLKNIYIIPIVK